MARAHRHYLPGLVWHITQRCHKQEFLLKLEFYRNRWLYWLCQANQRFHISILDYIVTSNHIHLLILSDSEKNDIAKTMHLVSGRIAWEFNQDRGRKGAFWGDRYHATAVESDDHLIRCMLYIDMNMVRAGVVKHPVGWLQSGYLELIGRKQKYALIDKERLLMILHTTERSLQKMFSSLVKEALEKNRLERESCWTESVAVGNCAFVQGVRKRLGIKVKGRSVVKRSGLFELR